jgi:flagellar biosynthesis/type III secretory pathway chaperone
MQPHQHQLPKPPSPSGMSPADMMKSALRLREILEQENALLTRMKIREIGVFTEEKNKLSMRLEYYQRLLASDPVFIAGIDNAQREALLVATDELSYAIEENMHRTLVARAANQRVMQTITEALTDHHRLNTYGKRGQATSVGGDTISLSLNQKA